MAKITDTRARLLKVPVRYPLLETTSDVNVVLLEIDTDAGVTGHALAQYPMASALQHFLAGGVAGLLSDCDPLRPELVRKQMSVVLTNRTLGGLWANAASLVDIALWDIKGKLLGEPLWRLLGGARAHVDTYVTFGLPRYSREQLVSAARQLVEQGNTRLKMVVGASSAPQGELFGTPSAADIREDVARVSAVREAVGTDIEIMIDANKNPTLGQAAALARAVEPLGISWFEDPVAMADPALMAELRSRTSIPIASGSLGVGDVRQLRELVIRGAVDILQPNVRDIGGLTGGMKAAALAEAFNLPMSMGGNWPHLNMHLYGAAAQGSLLEFHLQGWSIAEQLYRNAPVPDGGVLTLPDRPGLGLDLDTEAVERHAL